MQFACRAHDEALYSGLRRRLHTDQFSGSARPHRSKSARVLRARIARTLEHHLVSITRSPGDIPFDVQQYRYLQYLNDQDGRLTDIGAGLGINPHF